MATVHQRAARKANAFSSLEAAKSAVIEVLGIEAGDGPKLVGAAARDAELVQITQIESLSEFLDGVVAPILELKASLEALSAKKAK